MKLSKLKKSKIHIVVDRIDGQTLEQKWREFVLSCIFREVVHVSADEASRIANPKFLKTRRGYKFDDFINYPPSAEYINLSEIIQENAGIRLPKRDYVLLNQRPSGNRYLMESKTGLPLGEYLHHALEDRGIPFKVCDFSTMTPKEQAELCGGAMMFISAHGAGCSNVIFTPKHCQVLEYNFRKYWNCDPMCDQHFHGVLADHQECNGKLKYERYFHKADFHNLCRLLDRPYREMQVDRYEGVYDRNPICRNNLFVDGTSLLAAIETQVSSLDNISMETVQQNNDRQNFHTERKIVSTLKTWKAVYEPKFKRISNRLR